MKVFFSVFSVTRMYERSDVLLNALTYIQCVIISRADSARAHPTVFNTNPVFNTLYIQTKKNLIILWHTTWFRK